MTSAITKFFSKEALSLVRSGAKSLIKKAVKNKWEVVNALTPAEIEQQIITDLGYFTTFYTITKSANKPQEIKYRLSNHFVSEWLQQSRSMADKQLIKDEETGTILLDGHPITNLEKLEIIKLISQQTKTNSPALMGYLNVALSNIEPSDFTATQFQHIFAGWNPENPSIINQWLSGCFNLNDPYSTRLFRKWIIGTARRIIQPGSSLDGCLVLQGKGGTGKTTFARTLLPAPFNNRSSEIYCDIKNPQKFVENIVGKSIICFDEMSALENPNTTEIFKQLVSSTFIDVRLPWRRNPQRFNLRAGFMGTTNRIQFITDPTLLRRMWVVQLPDELARMDFEFFERNKTELWKEALYLATQQEAVYLNPNEQNEVEENNRKFLAQ